MAHGKGKGKGKGKGRGGGGRAGGRVRGARVCMRRSSLTEWAHLARLEPARDAMEVKRVVADAPCNGALIARRRRLVSLALDACAIGGEGGEGVRIIRGLRKRRYG